MPKRSGKDFHIKIMKTDDKLMNMNSELLKVKNELTVANFKLEEMMKYILINEYGDAVLDDGVDYIFDKEDYFIYNEINNLTLRFGFTMDFAKDVLKQYVKNVANKIRKGE